MDDSIRNERVRMRTADLALCYQQDSTVMAQKVFIREKENEVLELRQKSGVCIKIVDNGGGYRPNSSNRGTGTGMKVIMQTIQILNMKTRNQLMSLCIIYPWTMVRQAVKLPSYCLINMIIEFKRDCLILFLARIISFTVI